MNKNWVIILCIFLATGCKSTNSRSTETLKVTKESLRLLKENYDFQLSSGDCMGPCPVFNIYKTDSVLVLESKKNLFESGDYYYLLKRNELNDFNKTIDISWSKYSTHYQSELKDLPTFTFKIRQEADTTLVIKVEGIEPKELLETKEKLIDHIKKYDWIRL